jgi:hypothetical protein
MAFQKFFAGAALCSRIAARLAVSSLTIAAVFTSIGLDAHATATTTMALTIPARIQRVAKVGITAP